MGITVIDSSFLAVSSFARLVRCCLRNPAQTIVNPSSHSKIAIGRNSSLVLFLRIYSVHLKPFRYRRASSGVVQVIKVL